MDEIKSETDTEVVKSETEVEVEETETTDSTETESPAELKARLARAEKKIERLKLNQKVEKKVESTLKEKTGELDENALDFLDLKGITESEDIEVIERIVKRTGQTVRQALKDDYVVAKLEANKKNREVAEATPSNSKRGGSQTNDLASAIAKFESTGALPDNYELRTKVVNEVVARKNGNRPSWH